MKINLSTFIFLSILILLFVTCVVSVEHVLKYKEYRQFLEPTKDFSLQEVSDADTDTCTDTEEAYNSDTSTASSNTSEAPSSKLPPSSSINEPTAREGLRSSLRYMQQVLLSLAGITFVFILLYSAYYIHMLRQVYGKKRVAE